MENHRRYKRCRGEYPSEFPVIYAAYEIIQTSITIDDVIYVIDGGKAKETSYNPDTGLSLLTEQWISRAAARQRRGRAGRTKPGVCYKLYTRKQAENMNPFPVPEILRIPLESISLTVKVVREHEDVQVGCCLCHCVRRRDSCRFSQHFLKKAIDPPDVSAMDKAWSTLQELGAIDKESKLTALGRHMASLLYAINQWLSHLFPGYASPRSKAGQSCF